MKGYIYAINGPNNKRYVGQTVRLSNRRWLHFNQLRKNVHRCLHLQAAFNKHGEALFTFITLEECAISILTEREQFHMDAHKGKLYNSAPAAGTNLGVKRTSEMRETYRLRAMGKVPSISTREKLRAAHKGRKQPQSEIDNRRAVIACPVILRDGQTFPTITEFAKACGFKYRAAVTNALARGHTFDMIAERRRLF